MAQKTTRRVDSESVQGKGTYVVVRKLTLGEAQTVRDMAKDGAVDDFAMSLNLLKDHVVEWNWSDAEERPFPLPSADGTILGKLTDDEAMFLVTALRGSLTEAALKRG